MDAFSFSISREFRGPGSCHRTVAAVRNASAIILKTGHSCSSKCVHHSPRYCIIERTAPATTAPPRSRRDNNTVAWFVNGDPVDDAAVREEARLIRPRYMESVGNMDPIEAEMQLREWARENVIERMLLKTAALADPEPVPPEMIE